MLFILFIYLLLIPTRTYVHDDEWTMSAVFTAISPMSEAAKGILNYLLTKWVFFR